MRSGLVVAATVPKATGTGEGKAAEEMIVRHSPGVRRITLGCDKGYGAVSFVAAMRAQRGAAYWAEADGVLRSTAGPRSILDTP